MNPSIMKITDDEFVEVVFEVHVTHPDGSWSLWEDGYTTIEDALRCLRDGIKEKRREQEQSGYEGPFRHQWRINRKVIVNRYFYIEPSK